MRADTYVVRINVWRTQLQQGCTLMYIHCVKRTTFFSASR